MTDEAVGGKEPLAHLVAAVRPVVDRPKEERIRFAREDRWVEYSAATRALEVMADMLDPSAHPAAPPSPPWL